MKLITRLCENAANGILIIALATFTAGAVKQIHEQSTCIDLELKANEVASIITLEGVDRGDLAKTITSIIDPDCK